MSQRSTSSAAQKFTPLVKKNLDGEQSEYNTVVSHKKNLTEREISNYFKKSKTSFSNYAAPLGKTGYKQKLYLKKLNENNENPRFAASKAGSVVGGLICGMHTSPKQEEVLSEHEDLEDIQNELIEADLEELEEDEITFVGETESQFFNYLKKGQSYGQEDAATVATSAVEAAGSIYSAKTSILSQKYG